MMQMNKNNDYYDFNESIPKEYSKIIISFIKNNKFGTISLIIQKGKIVGCDILERKRDF